VLPFERGAARYRYAMEMGQWASASPPSLRYTGFGLWRICKLQHESFIFALNGLN
jgi:hypothetical protein